MQAQKLTNRREFIRLTALGAAGAAILAACAPAAPPAATPVPQPAEAAKPAATTAPSAAPTPTAAAAAKPTEAPKPTTAPTVAAKPAAAKEPFKLIYNTWWPQMADVLKPMIPTFQAKFPNVTVEEQVLPYMEWIQKYEATMVAGTAPDTFCGNLFISPKFYKPDLHMEFTDRLKADNIDLKKDYFITATEIWCNKIYGLPFDLDSNAVFYNKTMIKKEYGKDLWDDMGGKWTINDWRDIMIACTKDTKGKGKPDQWGAAGHMPNHENWNQSMSFTNGGTIFDYDNMKYTWTSDIATETFKWGYDLWKEKKVYVPPEESKALSSAGVSSPFAAGMVATYYRAVADLPFFVREIGDKFEWDCIFLPGKTKEKPGVGLVAGNPNLVYAKTKHPDEAYEWVKFLCGDEVQTYFAKEGICVPTLKKAVPQFKQFPKVKHAYIFAEVPQNDYHIHILHFASIENRNLTGAKMDEIFTGGADWKSTIKAMNDELNAKVQYGDCMPFQGMKMPIAGGKVVQ